MSHNPKQERIFRLGTHAAGMAATIGLAAGIVFGVYRPIMAEKSIVDQQAEQTSDFVNTRAEILEKSRTLNSTLDEKNRLFEQAMSRIPETSQESVFLGQLAKLAGKSKLNIGRFRPGQVYERKGYKELELNLSATASYSSLCRFLAGLETTPRLCRVTKLTIGEALEGQARRSNDRANPRQLSAQYSVEMTIIVFFAPLEENQETSDDES
jgi:Tfp pilus assembly protein PilO